MSQEDNGCRQRNKARKVFRVIFGARAQAAEAGPPGKESLDFPPSPVAAQRSSILGGGEPVDPVGCNHLRAVILPELLIPPVAFVSIVAHETFRHVRNHARFQSGPDQFCFSRRSTFCPRGERKSRAVGPAQVSLHSPNTGPPNRGQPWKKRDEVLPLVAEKAG